MPAVEPLALARVIRIASSAVIAPSRASVRADEERVGAARNAWRAS
jgi:hypothetical protein